MHVYTKIQKILVFVGFFIINCDIDKISRYRLKKIHQLSIAKMLAELSIGTNSIEVLEREKNLTYLMHASLSQRCFLIYSYCKKWTAHAWHKTC